MTAQPRRRVLLKLSGEALMGQGQFGIDPEVMHRVDRVRGNAMACGSMPGRPSSTRLNKNVSWRICPFSST